MNERAEIDCKVRKAAKWSFITEIATKFITPITSIILARLLAPDAFGVVATVSMITSFVDIFADAGFQKYLVQHEFKDEKEKYENTNVAFLTNLSISLFIFIVIVLCRDFIASAVGNKELANVIAIACISLPLISFSSIQTALYRRKFDFTVLFIARIICAIIPLIITIPLAVMGYGYWALIIGTISGNASYAIFLSIKSDWKPSFFYKFSILKEMIDFSLWSLLDTIVIWLTAWIDIFIISSMLSTYELGLYKNSLNMVNSLMAMITSSIVPVLFSTLSRLQNDQERFNKTFLIVQKIMAFILFPIGIGGFLYKDFATELLLGSKWHEASDIIGIWSLTSAVRIVMVSIYSEVYRAKGLPRISLFLQFVDLLFLVPTCIFSINYGFYSLVYARALVRFDLIVPGLFVINKITNISIKVILINISKPLICTILISIVAKIMQTISNSNSWNVFSIILCMATYIILFFLIDRNEFIRFVNMIIKKPSQ